MKHKNTLAVYVRNFVFGVEDSLVSTVGLLSGIASAGASTATIFLTGTVLIFVEAFSMAVGSYLSEESVEEYEKAIKLYNEGRSVVEYYSTRSAAAKTKEEYARFDGMRALNQWILEISMLVR